MQPFTIPFSGLKAGRNHFDWKADKSFFAIFGNTEILDADLEVSADILCRGESVEVNCKISGTVRTACDRCLEDLVIPVETGFGEENFRGSSSSEVLDLGQDIYDYVCTSLPMVRVHPEGECNAETLKYLKK